MLDDRIKETLRYDSETGFLFWKIGFGPVVPGKRAGTLNQSGYILIQVSGKKLSAHRLAWFLYYGKWPEKTIDHKNRVRTDNRIVNLRDVSQFENQQNTENSSGVTGVYWHKQRQKWVAQIFNGKKINLGRYKNFNDAVKARREAEQAIRL